jgi:hypothetical protein
MLKRWRTPCVFFVVHTLLVFAVYRSWVAASNATVRYDDPALIWLWPLIFDFPSSLLVQIMHPYYGIPALAAFSIIGGIQWVLIGGVLAWLLSRFRHGTPTI